MWKNCSEIVFLNRTSMGLDSSNLNPDLIISRGEDWIEVYNSQPLASIVVLKGPRDPQELKEKSYTIEGHTDFLDDRLKKHLDKGYTVVQCRDFKVKREVIEKVEDDVNWSKVKHIEYLGEGYISANAMKPELCLVEKEDRVLILSTDDNSFMMTDTDGNVEYTVEANPVNLKRLCHEYGLKIFQFVNKIDKYQALYNYVKKKNSRVFHYRDLDTNSVFESKEELDLEDHTRLEKVDEEVYRDHTIQILKSNSEVTKKAKLKYSNARKIDEHLLNKKTTV